MQVAKWGNSLAVRLPSAVVQALDLKEGDRIEIRIAGRREFEIARDRSTEQAIERIRRLRRPLPPGFKFDRLEANER
jgi:antitoxin MazE